MKKFRFLSMALVATAFVGCTSDDLDVAGGYVLPDDGTEVFATIKDPTGGYMRTGFATDVVDDIDAGVGFKAVFTKGDKFKMYCSDTWKPQTYKFKQHALIDDANKVDASVFEWADDENPMNYGEVTDLRTREYGVYPADNFMFTDEERSVLHYTLSSTINIGDLDDGNKFEGLENDIDDKGRLIYKSLIPMFGFCKDGEHIEFDYMTGLLRVDMLGMQKGTKYTLSLSSTESVWFYGDFKSEEFDATKGVESKAPVFKVQKSGNGGALNVTFVAAAADAVVYLPVPVGMYDLKQLKLTCAVGTAPAEDVPLYTLEKEKDAEGKDVRKTCASYDIEQEIKAGLALRAVIGNKSKVAPVEVDDWTKFNQVLADYADYSRDVEIDVTLTANLEGSASGYIKVPTLKNNLLLNIKSTSNNKFTTAEIKVVDIAGKGEGTLTLNFADGTIDQLLNSTSKQNITVAGHVTSGVKFDAGTATVGLNGYIRQAGIDIVSAGEVNIAETESEGIGTVNINGATTVNVADDGVLTALNVNENTEVNIEGAVGTITIADEKTAEIATSGAATIGEVKVGTGNKAGTYTIAATWDEVTTEAVSGEESTLAATDANDGEIYTALQLAALSKLDGTSYTFLAGKTTINLYADITVEDEAAAWTPLYYDGLTAFNGKEHTIKGLTVTGAKDVVNEQLGFFKKIDSAATIDGLTLENITINLNSKAKDGSNGIGALAGEVSENVTVQNVVIKGAKLNGDKTTYNVGGLFGKVSRYVNIYGTSIDAAIKGAYNLGGIAGTSWNGTVTVGDTDEEKLNKGVTRVEGTTSIEVLLELATGETYNDNAGTVALGIGKLGTSGSLNMVNMIATHSNVNANDWKYNWMWKTINNRQMFFKGCTNGTTARYYVGYSPEAGTVTLQGIELDKYYDGSQVSTTGTNRNRFNLFAE